MPWCLIQRSIRICLVLAMINVSLAQEAEKKALPEDSCTPRDLGSTGSQEIRDSGRERRCINADERSQQDSPQQGQAKRQRPTKDEQGNFLLLFLQVLRGQK